MTMTKTILTILLCAAAVAARAATQVPPTADAIADAMQGAKVIVLGEVHDNAVQHALRAAALRKVVERGARPAIAFEQFDRENQDAIDRARKEKPGDVDYLIAQGKGASSWGWAMYKPFIALALEYDLPIVAANLSRAGAMKVATGGAPAGDVPPAILDAQVVAVKKGHCDLLPAEALPGMARAQVERDRTLAVAIAPYESVVLLTGNEHGRKDIAVPHWLPHASKSIALLEEADGVDKFDAYVVTERQARPDPCEELRKRMKPKG